MTMAEFYPDYIEQEQERESIIKLGHLVTNRIPYKLKLKKLKLKHLRQC